MSNDANRICALLLLHGSLTLALAGAVSTELHAHDRKTRPDEGGVVRVLVFSATAWYRHPAIPEVNGFLARLGQGTGLRLDITESPRDLTAERLANYDVLLLSSTTDIGKSLDESTRAGVRDWFRAGHGIVGLHAALVHHDTWPWFTTLAACDFDSDSDFLEAKLRVDPGAKDHPIVRGFGPEFHYTADWTNHTRSVTGVPGVNVLVRIDETSYEPVREAFQKRGGKPMGEDHPVVWTREFEGGRFFYSELGHEVRSLDTEFGRQHLIEGIRWAAGKRVEGAGAASGSPRPSEAR
jgi:type 1 glutamine amidotransferase